MKNRGEEGEYDSKCLRECALQKKKQGGEGRGGGGGRGGGAGGGAGGGGGEHPPKLRNLDKDWNNCLLPPLEFGKVM